MFVYNVESKFDIKGVTKQWSDLDEARKDVSQALQDAGITKSLDDCILHGQIVFCPTEVPYDQS